MFRRLFLQQKRASVMARILIDYYFKAEEGVRCRPVQCFNVRGAILEKRQGLAHDLQVDLVRKAHFQSHLAAHRRYPRAM